MDLWTRYTDNRAAYINEANHFDGRNGHHQHTGNYYRNGHIISTSNPATDRTEWPKPSWGSYTNTRGY